MYGIGIEAIAIIIITAVISFKGFNDQNFFNRYLFHVGSIRNGEHFRMFSSGFLHADVQHLAFNMITLFFFAGIVATRMGSLGFLAVYLISLLCGNLLSYYMHRNDPQYSAIGASGAVMGIVYAAILLEPRMYIYGFIPGYVFGLGYLLYSIYGMKTRTDNLGHDAHFGGAVAGYVAAIISDPYLIWERPLIVGLMALPIVILVIMKRTGKL
jgi:membrane associated rhomboid family serine protease